MIDLPEALVDDALFGRWFAGPSWAPWRAVIKGAWGRKLDDDELKLFRSVAQRDPPRRRVRELWACVGRRGGKDSVASAIGTHRAAFSDYGACLRPGEMAAVTSIATDRQQAKISLRYARAYFSEIEMLSPLILRETADGFDLTTRVEFSVMTNNFRSVRGRPFACVILSECAFFKSEESTTPDVETYIALVPGLATIPDSLIVGVSSPYRKSGLLYQKWKDHFGRADDDVLVIQAPSRMLNPILPERVVAEAIERDPAAARAEWLGEFRDDIAAFLAREIVDAAVDRGVTVRPRVPGATYHAFADPSGGVSDSFTAGVAHAEGDVVFLDALIEIKAPFNPATATATIAETLKGGYGITSVTADRYAAGWVVEAFARQGIQLRHSDRDRSAIYSDVLPLFTAGRARLLDNQRLVTQFANLERKTSSMGRDRIDHPANGADDASNAAAGALVLASSKRENGWLGYMRGLAEQSMMEIP